MEGKGGKLAKKKLKGNVVVHIRSLKYNVNPLWGPIMHLNDVTVQLYSAKWPYRRWWVPPQWQASVPWSFSLVPLFMTNDGRCVGLEHTHKLHTTLHIHAIHSLANKVHLHPGYLLLQGASRSVCLNKAEREKRKRGQKGKQLVEAYMTGVQNQESVS